MAPRPIAIDLELVPRTRRDMIDVAREIGSDAREQLARYRRTLYCSYHTTAGYLEQALCQRLAHDRRRLGSFLDLFQNLFPPGADYTHDRMHLRGELTADQRAVEPRNADSHLTFIGSGLHSCVTYRNRPGTPVWFIDLDGVHEHGVRRRKTTVLGFDHEEVVDRVRLEVPVSRHSIDSINLRDARLGFYDELQDRVRCAGIDKGRIDLSLAGDEHHSGLTVNEYETLLMRSDLHEVLGDPLRFMVERGKSLLRDPRRIPNKTLDYARYDLVAVLNEFLDVTGFSESFVERIVARVMALPARRFLRLRRSISLPVIDADGSGEGTIVHGRYQSPILIQWRAVAKGTRQFEASLVRFR